MLSPLAAFIEISNDHFNCSPTVFNKWFHITRISLVECCYVIFLSASFIITGGKPLFSNI
jgi:hypothetical protein